jgi:phage terminase large subunit-like protein
MREPFYSSLAQALRQSADADWRVRARPAQLPPPEFSIWLLLSGRGFGKSWAGANYTCELGGSGAAKRIALLGPTADHVRQTMVEGMSGILNVAPAWCRPTFESSRGQLTWPSGSIATIYSADTPEALRGPEHDFAWCDELASWRRPETWDNLLLTLRIGSPRIVVTTTPRPTKLIRDLVAREGTDGIVITRGTTYDNRANLAPQFFQQLMRRFEGTRLARQELLGQVLEDVPGALWNREILEATRVDGAPELQRVVIGIDPAGSTAAAADLTGIIACGLGQDGHCYVLADLSCRGTPREWAGKAIGAFHSLKADKIVVERNFGGDMAAATLASVDPAVPVKEVQSSRAKTLRAEPVASIFEQKRAHIVGALPELEDQLCSFTSDWNRARDGSPDRTDALVFGVSELMLGRPIGGYFAESALLVQGEPAAMPQYAEYTFAVVTSSDQGDVIAAVYFSYSRMPHELWVVDWDLARVEPQMFGEWLPQTVARLQGLAVQCGAEETDVALWLEREGVGAAIFQQGAERRLPVCDVCEHLELPRELAERVSDVSGWIHGGGVKIVGSAHSKITAFDGVLRNHFLAQFTGYRIGAEVAERGELLSALCAGLVLAAPTEVRRKRRRYAS